MCHICLNHSSVSSWRLVPLFSDFHKCCTCRLFNFHILESWNSCLAAFSSYLFFSGRFLKITYVLLRILSFFSSFSLCNALAYPVKFFHIEAKNIEVSLHFHIIFFFQFFVFSSFLLSLSYHSGIWFLWKLIN